MVSFTWQLHLKTVPHHGTTKSSLRDRVDEPSDWYLWKSLLLNLSSQRRSWASEELGQMENMATTDHRHENSRRWHKYTRRNSTPLPGEISDPDFAREKADKYKKSRREHEKKERENPELAHVFLQIQAPPWPMFTVFFPDNLCYGTSHGTDTAQTPVP